MFGFELSLNVCLLVFFVLYLYFASVIISALRVFVADWQYCVRGGALSTGCDGYTERFLSETSGLQKLCSPRQEAANWSWKYFELSPLSHWVSWVSGAVPCLLLFCASQNHPGKFVIKLSFDSRLRPWLFSLRSFSSDCAEIVLAFGLLSLKFTLFFSCLKALIF